MKLALRLKVRYSEYIFIQGTRVTLSEVFQELIILYSAAAGLHNGKKQIQATHKDRNPLKRK